MKRSKTDVLIFAEDAGAANYLVHLPEGLQQAGCPVVLLADGVARKFFADRGMAYVPADGLGGAAKILDRFVPRLVVTGASENPESLGLFLTDEARKKDIPSVGVVDAFMNAEYRFRGVTDNALAHVPEYLLVPDRATGHEFVRLGVPAGKVFVCGHPQYDFVREQAKRMEREGKHAFRRRFFPNAPEEAKIVIFAAEQPGGLNREDFLRSDKYTLFGRGKSQTRNEIVLEEFLDAVALMDMRPWLVLRLPPKASPENFTSFLDAFDQVSWTETGSGTDLCCGRCVRNDHDAFAGSSHYGPPHFFHRAPHRRT